MIIRDRSNPFLLLFAWQGTILPAVLPALAVIFVLSLLLDQLSAQGIIQRPGLPAASISIFGLILSIFMVFRNSACHERWWEGRKLWGALIANARHLARDSHLLPAAARECLLYQVILFTRLLRDRLRYQTAHPGRLPEYADPELPAGTGVADLDKRLNPPQHVLEHIQKNLVRRLEQGQLSDILYMTLNRHLVELGNIQAGCDRIASTPLPFSYSVLLHRSVYAFCLILPFVLEGSTGFWTPFLACLIAYMFLGLDALGSQLEEPFGTDANDLPLDFIVRLVERELLDSLGKPLPPAIPVHNSQLP